MTHDFTYLNQLPVQELISRALRGTWTGPEAHMIRALAVRLEEYVDAMIDYDAVNEALVNANAEAERWRDEAQAIERQLAQVRT